MMNSPSKLGSLALILSGVLMGIGLVLHPDERNPASVAMPMWGPAHWLIVAAALLAIFGFAAVYVRWLRSEGSLGLAAFVLITAGMALLVGVAMIEAGVIAPMAARPEAAALLAEDGPILTGPLGSVFMLLTLTLTVGSVLIGYLLYRGKQVPMIAALLVLVCGALTSLSQFLPYPVPPVAGGLLGLGMAWIGYVMWSGPGQA